LYEEPISDGPNQGHVIAKEDINKLLTWYYSARGWNENGIPTRETLISAGLTEVVEEFENRGLLAADG
jgi:aldehyde:ferredoxin oxidoreductase